MNERTEYHNYFLFPAILCLMQFCFVFISLFRSGFDFTTKVLIADLFLLLLWLGLFVYHFVNFKSIKFSLKNIFILLAYIFAGICIIKDSWFHRENISLNCINDFFNGRCYIDTLYHSSIAESFITNGYSSVLINDSSFVAYHTLSHAFIAFISKVLDLPCFVTYNYLYPVIAYPLFTCLFQKVVIIAHGYLVKSYKISFVNKIFLILAIIGFNLPDLHSKYGYYYFNNLLISESYCISIIILFLYFCIIDFGYRKIKGFGLINLYVLIPIAIIAMSYCKVSTGFIFFIGISYFVFRKNLFLNKKWFVIFFYAFVFALYYFIPGKFVPESTYLVSENSSSKFDLFHYVKYTCKLDGQFSVISGFIHYILIFAPIIIILVVAGIKNIFSFKVKEPGNKLLVFETLIIATIVSILPGIILHIDGGSAGYFECPVVFAGLVVLIGLDVFTNANQVFVKKNPKFNFEFKFQDKLNFKSNILFSCFILFICFAWCKDCYKIAVKQMLKETVFYRLTEKTKMYGTRKEKLNNLFSSSELLANKDYRTYTNIRNETKNNRNQYCIFLKDDANLIKLYDSYWLGINNTDASACFFIDPYLATAAYTGLPVINAMYISDNNFYRGDNYKIGKYISGYSLPPKKCGVKVTLDNMKEYAKKINKSHIVIIGKDGYEIVDTETSNDLL